jgi:hypothetical protein
MIPPIEIQQATTTSSVGFSLRAVERNALAPATIQASKVKQFELRASKNAQA